MNQEHRKVVALITVDNNRAVKEGKGTIAYLQQESGWMEESGITMDCAFICDEDEEEIWLRYMNYLIQWTFEHSDEKFRGQSPLEFKEWLCKL